MTAGTVAIFLVVLAILIFCSALFSAVETALFSLKSHQLRRLETNHASLTKFVQFFRDNPRRVLNVLLLGDGLVNVLLVIWCLFFLWESPLATHIPLWMAALLIFAVVVLVCDLIPKLLALSVPYRLSTIGAFALQVSMPLLDRIGHQLERVSVYVVDRLTSSGIRVSPRLSDEELETLIEMSEEEGALYEGEAEIIQEIIKLGDKTAKDCMTPRVDTFMLPDDLNNEEAIARLKQHRYRRVPVYADTPDQILGIIDVKLFLLDPSEHYTEALIPPSFVSETMGALDLLKLFLSRPQGMGVVVDEFGGIEGIITMEDIVEEILRDVVPRDDVALYIEPLGNGRFLVSGNARLDDLSEYLGFQIDAEGIDTIGGFVFTRLGYLPPPGTKLEIPRLVITVRRAGRQRIEEILLEKTAPKAFEQAA
ncbi:MAG TPA: hemolysin family protein [Candidatus Udaeobacter sp.]|nr:hemolysin family protein [Candidatus Udaeobacter sp.]